MLSHAQHVARTQSKRESALAAMRKRFMDKEEAENLIRQERLARRAAMEERRRERELKAREELLAKVKELHNTTALSLEDVVILRPCGRLRAVHAILRQYWDADIPVSAEMALAAGCTPQDIDWVTHRLLHFQRVAERKAERLANAAIQPALDAQTALLPDTFL